MVGGDIVILCYWYTPLGVNVPPTDVVMWIHLHYYSRENYALPHDIISKSELIQPVSIPKLLGVSKYIAVFAYKLIDIWFLNNWFKRNHVSHKIIYNPHTSLNPNLS